MPHSKSLAAWTPAKLGQTASKVTQGVLETTQFGYAREKKTVTITPRFATETENRLPPSKSRCAASVAKPRKPPSLRTMPVVKHIESRMRDSKDLFN